jgi:hypothetical protein
VVPLVVMPFVVGLYLIRILKDRTTKGLLIQVFCRERPASEIDAHAHWSFKAWVQGRLRSKVVEELNRHRSPGSERFFSRRAPIVTSRSSAGPWAGILHDRGRIVARRPGDRGKTWGCEPSVRNAGIEA